MRYKITFILMYYKIKLTIAINPKIKFEIFKIEKTGLFWIFIFSPTHHLDAISM